MKINLSKTLIITFFLISNLAFADNSRVWLSPDASNSQINSVLFNMDRMKKLMTSRMIIRSNNSTNKQEIVKANQNVVVNASDNILVLPVEFSYDSKNITAESKTVLDKISFIFNSHKEKLDKASNYKIEMHINGYTDSVGPSGYNQTLSQIRVDTVKEYLAKKGFPKALIKTKGFGETNLLDSLSPKDPKNRRVEISAKIITIASN